MKREVANYFFVIVVFTGPMVDTNHFAFSSIGENGDFNFTSLTFFFTLILYFIIQFFLTTQPK